MNRSKIYKNCADIESVILLMRSHMDHRHFARSARLGRWLRKHSAASVQTFQWELTSLLELGREKKAKNIYWRWADRLALNPSYRSMFERFLAREGLAESAQSALRASRDVLGADLLKRRCRSSYLDDLAEFSDVVLISNNITLEFSDQDKDLMRAMKKPLFVYFNIGNPTLVNDRESFYGPEACELLMGGHHHIVDSESRLLFVPLVKHRFLGCLVRVNPRFLELWYGSLRQRAQRANMDICFHELDELLLIEALYPLTVVVNDSGQIKKRIPTIGWIALSLFDAIRSAFNLSMTLWSAGFSLSPSYIFGASGVGLHDFPFEHKSLDIRFKQGSLIPIGQLNSAMSELSTREHLDRAGIVRQQLSQQLRQKKLI